MQAEPPGRIRPAKLEHHLGRVAWVFPAVKIGLALCWPSPTQRVISPSAVQGSSAPFWAMARIGPPGIARHRDRQPVPLALAQADPLKPRIASQGWAVPPAT
jgi:hypothetical protein